MGTTNVFKPIQLSDTAAIYTNFTPAISNLYTIEIFGQSSTSENPNNKPETITDYLKFHSTNVTLPEETLTLERDPVTKTFKIQESGTYARANELTLTWREADDWRVRKFHENWLGKFYNRSKDCFISWDPNELTTAGLSRVIRITLPEPVSTDSQTFSENGVNAAHVIELRVLPHNIGQIALAWSTSPTLISHQLSYYILDWHWVEA